MIFEGKRKCKKEERVIERVNVWVRLNEYRLYKIILIMICRIKIYVKFKYLVIMIFKVVVR